MTREEQLAYLQAHLKPGRFAHSLGVEETAGQLARRYGLCEEKARRAGLLHDCAKHLPLPTLRALAEKSPYIITLADDANTLHAPAGSVLARTLLQEEDPTVLEAICWHTVPHVGMTPLEMAVSLADSIEPNRSYPGVEELRALARADLQQAFCAALRRTMVYLLQNNVPVRPESLLEYNRLVRK